MDSSPSGGSRALEPSLPSTTGVKRPAPSLLPPFEPLSSSPGLPRPLKRQNTNAAASYTKYPTPVPTSSTGILSSSPPRVGLGLGIGLGPSSAAGNNGTGPRRPGLQRTQSSVSERAPLSAVPAIELSENGETLLMGRSSNASHYQLSANRLISRIHVKARYIAVSSSSTPSHQPENAGTGGQEAESGARSPLASPIAALPAQPSRIEIICNGWNGCKLHCQGRTWELAKGDTFTSETEGAEIMLDVQDARVLIHWPKRDRDRAESLANLSDASSWDDSPRAPRAAGAGAGAMTPGLLQSSPLRRNTRIASPESPTPAHRRSGAGLNALLPDGAGGDNDASAMGIQIYEDASSDEQELPPHSAAAARQAGGDAGASFLTDLTTSFSSELSDPRSDLDNDDDDDEGEHMNPDEENDPIIHSFGPFGANLSSRLASFSTRSPKISRSPLVSRNPHGRTGGGGGGGDGGQSTGGASAAGALSAAVSSNATAASTSPPAPSEVPPIPAGIDVPAITNHVINQLAFSRLSSNPLTGIMNNLPAEQQRRGGLTKDILRRIIEATPCVGTIPRQGKDAAGKPLESEYYYVPEMDGDENRRAAVVDGLRKPSLRNCRKQHKVSFSSSPTR